MSRKHFQAIADILCAENASARLVDSLANYFKSDNPGFKKERFRTAVARCKR